LVVADRLALDTGIRTTNSRIRNDERMASCPFGTQTSKVWGTLRSGHPGACRAVRRGNPRSRVAQVAFATWVNRRHPGDWSIYRPVRSIQRCEVSSPRR